MDYQIAGAGRITHIKIAVTALVAVVAVVAVGINARVSDVETARTPAGAAVVKAGQPAVYAGERTPAVR